MGWGPGVFVFRMSLYGREAMAFFDKLKEADAGNGKCVDCGANSPLWASLSYGTYFCLECSGVHRNLGVHISFVRSLNMDSWSEQQQQRMTCGGNTAFRQYLRQCGMPEELQSGGGQFAGCESQAEGAIRQKYNTRSAAAYRAWLAERSRGEGAPAPPSVPCARESGASTVQVARPGSLRHAARRYEPPPPPPPPTGCNGGAGGGAAGAGVRGASGCGSSSAGRMMQGFGSASARSRALPRPSLPCTRCRRAASRRPLGTTGRRGWRRSWRRWARGWCSCPSHAPPRHSLARRPHARRPASPQGTARSALASAKIGAPTLLGPQLVDGRRADGWLLAASL